MDQVALALAKKYTDEQIRKSPTGEVLIDKTLSKEGYAADAKAVGDAISKISGQNLSLDTTLTQSGKAADAAAVGAALDELDEKIPTKPEDIGAQPKGDYLTAVPAGYATEEFVKNKIAEAELGGEEVDLSDYAQKSELPTKVSQLENDKGYLTAVPDGYAKTEDIPKKPADIGAQPAGNYLTSIPEEYITESELDSKGYLTDFTESDPTVPAWAKEPSKPTYTASEVGALSESTKIPSKVSDLDNDKKYITAAEVPDEIYVGDGTMPNTATIQFIMDASDEEVLLKNELQEYINAEIEAAKTKLELDIPEKTSQLTNDSGFITAEDIPEVQVPDLSDYAKTKDIPTKTSQLTNDSGFITQHQSLSGYAKTSDIPTKVSQLTNDSGFITAKDVPEAQVPDLSGYALKSSAETWTFTLFDGSTVTKKVVLA